MTRRRVTAVVVVALLGSLVPGGVALGQRDEGELRSTIDRSRAREQQLTGSLARLGRLLSKTQREVALLQRRLAAVQQELSIAEARLNRTKRELDASRARLKRLRERLARDRKALADQLRASYMDQRPDLVTVVLGASSFSDLVERLEFLGRIRNQNTRVVDAVRRDRDATRSETMRLERLEKRRRETAEGVERQRDALASMAAGLRQRQAAFARARAARAAALSGTRAGRRRAERQLGRLIAERQRAAAAPQPVPGSPSPGQNGNWAIPWPIVQCESGGQNLPPNSAGASGYYQFMPDTWRRLGGSTKHAYQASKAEQDRLAARLWAGGAGARNWVCAGMVG